MTATSAQGVTAPAGFEAAGVAVGLKSTGKPDVAVVVNRGPLAVGAAVFTSNRAKANPILWSQQAIADGVVEAIVLNSGGANCFTGSFGFQTTHQTAEKAAELLGISPGDVLVCSTGLIGTGDETFRAKVLTGTEDAISQLSADGGESAARAIMTTDTVPKTSTHIGDGWTIGAMAKGAGMLAPGLATMLVVLTTDAVLVCSTGLIGTGDETFRAKVLTGTEDAISQLSADGGESAARAIMTTDTVPKTSTHIGDGWTIGAMAKGAGMLAPGLATMLVVLTTDAVLDAAEADAHLRAATRVSFDRLDSDGCMSTNDQVTLLVSGASGITPDPAAFGAALTEVCLDLAAQLQGDAEGASHDITIRVVGAVSEADAVEVGRSVARNNLFKAAIFGNDPNWGRVLAAIGTTQASFDPYAVDVSFNGVRLCSAGAPDRPREEVDLTPRATDVLIDLQAGDASATILTNDLTHDYVHENSAYSS